MKKDIYDSGDIVLVRKVGWIIAKNVNLSYPAILTVISYNQDDVYQLTLWTAQGIVKAFYNSLVFERIC